MKFNIEIDIDWIYEDSSLDEAVKDNLISGLARKLENEFLADTGKQIALAANKLITAKTELLINTVLEKPVVVSNGGNDKREYDSIYDMVEEKMTSLYQGRLNNSGKCEKDPLLSKIEKYVESHMKQKLSNVESLINKHAKLHAESVLKESKLINSLREIIPNIDEEIQK